MDKRIVVFVTALILLLLLGGFFFFAQKRSDDGPVTPTDVPATATPSADSNNQVGVPQDVTINSKKLANNYFVFERSEYEKAKAANRPILLFFYANWCPTCARQEPINVATFNNLGQTNLISFRVNYNDTDTSKEEEDLAKEFGVPYQHNFYLLNQSGEQISHFQGQTSEEMLKKEISVVK